MFGVRALSAPPLCRHVRMVAWYGVEVNYSYASASRTLTRVAYTAGHGLANLVRRVCYPPLPPQRGSRIANPTYGLANFTHHATRSTSHIARSTPAPPTNLEPST